MSTSTEVTSSTPAVPAPQATPTNAFTEEAEAPQMSLFAEFKDFLLNNSAWWLTPIIIVLMGVGALVALSSTVAAPFIYTLF